MAVIGVENNLISKLLEEPRADLTALHSINLLYKVNTSLDILTIILILFFLPQSGAMSDEEASKMVGVYLVMEMRRFASWNRKSVRAYVISAANVFKALSFVSIFDIVF